MHPSFFYLILIFASLFLSACSKNSEDVGSEADMSSTAPAVLLFSDGEHSFYGPKRSPEEIAKRARQFIIDSGLPIEKYKLNKISFSYLTQKWRLTYSRENIRMGGFLPIRVDDSNPDEIEFYEK